MRRLGWREKTPLNGCFRPGIDFQVNQGANAMANARVVRGSEGEVYEPTWVFKHGSRTGAPFDFLIGNVDYLSGPPLHVHDTQHDSFYVLEGVLAVQIGDEILDMMPGDFVSVPPGTAHTFYNIRKGQPPVKVCNLMTPGGLDEFWGTVNDLGPKPDPAQLAAARRKFGSTVVGPTLRDKLGLAK
jgi:mannose-6-phosphate isomerase-like protein (cupin superfamily)